MGIRFLFAFITFLLSGCSTTHKVHFPDYYTPKPPQARKIDVVIDSLIVSDIKGNDIGIDKKKNIAALTQIEKMIQDLLKVRGYQANVIYHGTGLTHKFDDRSRYVYIKNWSPTGQRYIDPIIQKSSNPWHSSQIKHFLQRILAQGKAIQYPQKISMQAKAIAHSEIPSFIYALPTNNLMIVRVKSELRRSNGLLELIISKGKHSRVKSRIDPRETEIVVFDKQKSRVVWYDTPDTKAKYTSIPRSLHSIIAAFPTINGKIYNDPDRAYQAYEAHKPHGTIDQNKLKIPDLDIRDIINRQTH